MRFSTISLAAAVSALLLAGSLTAEAGPCDPAKCVFPACVCPSVNPPKGMDPKTVPQFFTLTFDDAIQTQTVTPVAQIMSPHKNPNGCPIRATWFAQIMYSDFSLIQQWYAAGNEVADHTMTHPSNPPAAEIIGNRKAINSFAGIPNAKLIGFRAPNLNYSKGTFDTLAQEKFLYDSSTNAVTENAYWPYTLDFGLSNDCWTGICNEAIAAPGMWEVPMHAIMNGAEPYSMDPQLFAPAGTIAGLLKDNFNRHYQGTRQPFGIYLHPVHIKEAGAMYNEFFAWAAAQKDVWFVTNQQLLEWMKNPVPASELAAQEYMKCNMPAVGKEICNGLDDTKSGAIDKGLLETCNFPDGPWSTCYGCPMTKPTPEDPVPARVVAAGTAGARTPVAANCAMEWWDPIAAQCLCSNSTCAFTDIATATTSAGGSNPTNKPNPQSAAIQLSSSWASMGFVAAVAAGIAQML